MDTFSGGRALVVGIDDYPGPGVPSLPRTVLNDAEDVAKLLRTGDRCGYAESNVRTLYGRGATRDAIRAELDHLRTAADSDSTTVVYFSCHGARLPDGEYLLPADADGSSAQRVVETAISANEFSDRIARIPGTKLLTILDCCHAAGVAALKGTGVKAGLGEELYGRLYAGSGRAVLAACSADERAAVLRDTDRNSLFTTHLLDGLRGKAATDDGLVKVFGLFEYVQLRVTAAYRDQHPVLKADLRTNFPIALNNACERGVVARAPEAGYVYDACIAHADEDFDWVADHLIPALTKDGLRHTVSGKALGQFRVVAVQDAVKKSKYVLLIISPHFTSNRVTQLAGILGLSQGLEDGIGKVIPVKIGEPAAEVGLAIRALEGIDLTKSARRSEDETRRLLEQLHNDPQIW